MYAQKFARQSHQLCFRYEATYQQILQGGILPNRQQWDRKCHSPHCLETQEQSFLGKRQRRGGQLHMLHTYIGSCLQAGVKPHRWLTSTLEKIPNLKSPIVRKELLH